MCEQHPWHLHGHKFWVVGMGLGNWDGSEEQIASLDPVNAVKRDTVTVLPDAVEPFEGQHEQGRRFSNDGETPMKKMTGALVGGQNLQTGIT